MCVCVCVCNAYNVFDVYMLCVPVSCVHCAPPSVSAHSDTLHSKAHASAVEPGHIGETDKKYVPVTYHFVWYLVQCTLSICMCCCQ